MRAAVEGRRIPFDLKDCGCSRRPADPWTFVRWRSETKLRSVGMSVLSILQDTGEYGGVATVNHWYRVWMAKHRPEENIECYLDDSTTSKDFFQGLRTPIDFSRGRAGVPRLLPLLHIPQYYGGRLKLRLFASGFEELHTIGGVAVHGSMTPEIKKSIVWIGTTIEDERTRVIPYRDTLRRWLHRGTLPLLRRLEIGALSRATRILAQSHHTAHMITSLGVPPERVEVVPVPVDLDHFYSDAHERRGILFVARANDPRKNFSAALRLLDASPSARSSGLDVVSPGAVAPELARRFGQALRWHGYAADVAHLFRRAEVFLLPSRQEGLGIVVLEALASGTPVVVMRCGGPERFITESHGGFVVTNEDDMREKVEMLLRDRGLQKDMGHAGRSWAEKHVSSKEFLHDPNIFRAA